MEFIVKMEVHIPHTVSVQDAANLIRIEKEYSQKLQHEGKWKKIWRIVGQYANYSIFEVSSHQELHQILSNLPLFPYMKIEVTPLCDHPSAIN